MSGIWTCAHSPYEESDNLGFMAYATHINECDQVIEKIRQMMRDGDLPARIELNDNFTDDDIKYIQKEIECR